MKTKTLRFGLKLTEEEAATLATLAQLLHCSRSQAVVTAIYDRIEKAKSDAAFTAAWEKARAENAQDT